MKSLENAPRGAENVFKTLAVAAAAISMVSSAASLDFGASSAEPSTVQAGETVNNQVFSFEVQEVSADGNTDTFYVEFPNELNNSVSANQASFDNASVTSSVQLVDGPDADGVDETFRFATSLAEDDTVALKATLDASVDYPDEAASYAVMATVEDSSGDTSTAQIATIQAESQDSDSQESNPQEQSGDQDSDAETTSGDESSSSESGGLFAAIGSFITNLL